VGWKNQLFDFKGYLAMLFDIFCKECRTATIVLPLFGEIHSAFPKAFPGASNTSG